MVNEKRGKIAREFFGSGILVEETGIKPFSEKIVADINKRTNYNKAKDFFKEKAEVHVSSLRFKRDGTPKFYNGTIKDINKKFIILEDRYVGEMELFFYEIYNIERCRRRE